MYALTVLVETCRWLATSAIGTSGGRPSTRSSKSKVSIGRLRSLDSNPPIQNEMRQGECDHASLGPPNADAHDGVAYSGEGPPTMLRERDSNLSATLARVRSSVATAAATLSTIGPDSALDSGE